MSLEATPQESREDLLTNAPSGLLGALEFAITDETGAVLVHGPRSEGIQEVTLPDGLSLYRVEFDAPLAPGDYLLRWGYEDRFAYEDLYVRYATVSAPPSAPFVVAGFAALLPQRGHLLRRAEPVYVEGTPTYPGSGDGFVELMNFPCRFDIKSGSETIAAESDARKYVRTATVFTLPPEYGGPPARRDDQLIVDGIAGVFQITFPKVLLGFGSVHHLEIEVVATEGN